MEADVRMKNLLQKLKRLAGSLVIWFALLQLAYVVLLLLSGLSLDGRMLLISVVFLLLAFLIRRVKFNSVP
ncbi:MAG TPA: hypothetical protein ENN60_01755 [archaeon]|nr:hypothetical protein [archaeon]